MHRLGSLPSTLRTRHWPRWRLSLLVKPRTQSPSRWSSHTNRQGASSVSRTGSSLRRNKNNPPIKKSSQTFQTYGILIKSLKKLSIGWFHAIILSAIRVLWTITKRLVNWTARYANWPFLVIRSLIVAQWLRVVDSLYLTSPMTVGPQITRIKCSSLLTTSILSTRFLS